MSKPELEEIFRQGNMHLQYDKNTCDLYVNNKKLVTEIELKIGEKFLAWIVAASVFVQAVMAIVTYFG